MTASTTRVPPGPSRASALSMLMVMARDRLGMMTAAAQRYGDAVVIPVGHKRLYFFNRPDYAKHVLADNSTNYHKGIGLVHARRALGDGLLTSEGELWRKQRSVIQPAFASRRVAAQANVIAQEARQLVDRLRARVGQGPVDVVREMTALTLGVLGRALLDADLRVYESIGDQFSAVQDQAMFELATLSAVPMWLPLPRQLRFRRARAALQEVVDDLVDERSNDVGGDDVLSRLIVSARGEADPAVGRQRLRDELVTLLLAGHETTASTLSWTLYLIDRHPAVRLRLEQEARDVLDEDRLPSADELRGLRYTSMVIQEAMRMYPPVWILPRVAQAADEVGGYHVPAGADVLICPYTLHRHPRYWRDPARFLPRRFDPEAAKETPSYAYLPFGAGPRFCVGNHLGMLEATIVIAVLCRAIRLHTVPGHEVVPEPMLSLRVRGGLPMTVHRVGETRSL